MRASVFRRASQEPASPSPARRARSTERSVDNVFRLDREASSGEFQDDDLAVEEHDIDSERLASAHMTEEGGDGADKRKTHRRAMSDPFDTADSGGATDNESRTRAFSHADSFDTTTEALPTLPRFPHAESRDKNCWSEPSVSIFHVRGQRYLEDKKKIPSGPYLLPARGVDLFVTGSPHEYQLGEHIQGALGGNLRRAPTLVVRFTFPWGILLQYFEIPSRLAPFMNPAATDKHNMDGLSNAEQCVAKWLLGDSNYRNERFKLIPYVAEGPWVVRNLVTGKPALIGKKLPVTYRYTPPTPHPSKSSEIKHDFLVVDLDIGNSSATAKRIVSVCRRYMSALTVDIGFVIEGQTPHELPEQMLGSLRIHQMDPLKAPQL